MATLPRNLVREMLDLPFDAKRDEVVRGPDLEADPRGVSGVDRVDQAECGPGTGS